MWSSVYKEVGAKLTEGEEVLKRSDIFPEQVALVLATKVQKPPCSFGLSATSQQYFSLRTNQPPATSQQYFSLRTNQHQPPAKRTDRKEFDFCRQSCSPNSGSIWSSPVGCVHADIVEFSCESRVVSAIHVPMVALLPNGLHSQAICKAVPFCPGQARAEERVLLS
jgi:hypothetical protein